MDPLSPQYPWYTPYQFAGNKPINSVDLDGLEEKEAYDQNEEDILRSQGRLDGRSITRLVGANPRDLNLNNPYDQSYLKSSWNQAEVNQALTKQLFEYVGDASMMIGGMFDAVGMTYSNPVNITANSPTKLGSWFRGLSTTFRNLFRRGGNKLPTIKQVRASHIDEVAGSELEGMLRMKEMPLGAVEVNYSNVLNSASSPYKGSTVLGHSLSKHVRNPSIWGKLVGDKSTWHNQALQHFDDIMNAPGSFIKETNDYGINFLEKRLSDGRGIRLNMDKTFKGFID